MLFTPGSRSAGLCRRLMAKLVPAVRAAGGVAVVCAATAACAPAANPYGTLRPAAAADDRTTDAPRPAGAAPRAAMDGPAGAGALGGMDEAVEGHREGRW